MGYVKRYEDSYLDDEDTDQDAAAKTPARRLAFLVAQESKTTAIWAEIADLALALGDKETYYKAMDELSI